MSSSRSSCRLRLVGLEVRMWRAKACPRLILPVPVLRKRLAAPLWVFILGISMFLVSGFSFLDTASSFSRKPEPPTRTALRFLGGQNRVQGIAFLARAEF